MVSATSTPFIVLHHHPVSFCLILSSVGVSLYVFEEGVQVVFEALQIKTIFNERQPK